MKSIYCMLLAGMAVVFTACEKPTPKLRESWSYTYKVFNENGDTLINAPVQVFGREYSDPSWIESVNDHGVNIAFPPYGIYKYENGELLAKYCHNTDCVTTTFLNYPGTVGENHYCYWDPYNLNKLVTVKSVDNTLTLPFGNVDHVTEYECLIFGAVDSKVWFNDHLWFVKYEKWDSLTSGTGVYKHFSYELLDYHDE